MGARYTQMHLIILRNLSLHMVFEYLTSKIKQALYIHDKTASSLYKVLLNKKTTASNHRSSCMYAARCVVSAMPPLWPAFQLMKFNKKEKTVASICYQPLSVVSTTWPQALKQLSGLMSGTTHLHPNVTLAFPSMHRVPKAIKP
jgi:hypothetical protein